MMRRGLAVGIFLLWLVMIPVAGQAGVPMDTAKAGVDRVVAVAGDKDCKHGRNRR